MELLAKGREAEVFALDADRVLRRFVDPGRSAGREVELLGRLAGLGYPVPAVHSWVGPDLVLERVEGPRLSDELLGGTMPLADGVSILADLHDRLHALPWGGSGLVHLDLHPENVLLGRDGPVVIDWSTARAGEAGLDVAMTGLILAQVAVAMATKGPVVAALLTEFVSAFVAAVSADPTAYVDQAKDLRRQNPTMTPSEVAHLSDATDLLRLLS